MGITSDFGEPCGVRWVSVCCVWYQRGYGDGGGGRQGIYVHVWGWAVMWASVGVVWRQDMLRLRLALVQGWIVAGVHGLGQGPKR